MGEPRLTPWLGRRLRSGGLAQRYLDCSGKLQECEGTQAGLPTTGNRNNHRNRAIRPFNWQPNEPTLWVLGINVLLPILATDGPHHRQAYASQWMDWKCDGHPF
jgi:hypothetical protein